MPRILTALKILKRAKQLFYHGKISWTQHAYARDKYDAEINPNHHLACQYCLTGAIILAHKQITKCEINDIYDSYESYQALKVTTQENAINPNNECPASPIEFNDQVASTKKEIVNMLTKTINNLQNDINEIKRQQNV